MPTKTNDITRALLWLLLIVLWFGTLGYRDLIHPDEGRYAELAREMAQSGDWITPRLDGLKYFEKPALHYWISAAAFKMFGESEWVARLWPGLSGFLTIVALYFTAKKYSGQRVADFTALVAAGSIWSVGDSHYLTLDMGLTFFMTLALYGFLLAFHSDVNRSQQRNYLFIAWAAMACAVLSKGLIGIVLPAAVLVIYTLFTRQWFIWKRINWISGTLLFLFITAPWFIIVSLHNPEFFHFFFIHEHLQRYTTTEHQRIGSWYYFIPVLLGGLLPWTSLLPKGLAQIVNENKNKNTFRPQLFLFIWIVFIFIFFSASGSKLPSYILPVFPALSLLLGNYIEKENNSVLKWHAIALSAFWIFISIALLLASQQQSEMLDRNYLHWAGLCSVPLAGLCMMAAWYFVKENKMLAVLLLSVSTLTAGQALIQGHQIYSADRSAKIWVATVQDKLDADAPFYSVSFYNQTVPFYLKHTMTLVNWVDEFELGMSQEPGKAIPTEAEFFKIWLQQPGAAAIIQADDFARMKTRLGNIEVLYNEQGKVIIKKMGVN